MEQNHRMKPIIVQLHRSSLMVEDADSEILLNVDRKLMEKEEFAQYMELARFSGVSLRLKDLADAGRIRKTFMETLQNNSGNIPYIDSVQIYYLSRISSCSTLLHLSFFERREYCLETIQSVFAKDNSGRVVFSSFRLA